MLSPELEKQLLELHVETKDDPRLVLVGSRAMWFWGLDTHRPANPNADCDLIGSPMAALRWLNNCTEPLTDLKLIKQYAAKETKDAQASKVVFHKLLGRIGKHAFEIELITTSSATSSASLIVKHCLTQAAQDIRWLSLPGQRGTVRCEAIVAPIEVLETIKRSHILWLKKWEQHMQDMHALRSASPKTIDAIFTARRQEHMDLFGGDPAAHINLAQSNEDFLDKYPLTVKRYLKHDDIHDLVAYGDKPMYTRIKPDTEEGQAKAMCDRKMFEALTLYERLNCVREECMVIALERYLLPGRAPCAQLAYETALQRVCTSLTKGWFREFAIDFWPKLLPSPESKLKDLMEIKHKIHELCVAREQKEQHEKQESKKDTAQETYDDDFWEMYHELAKYVETESDGGGAYKYTINVPFDLGHGGYTHFVSFWWERGSYHQIPDSHDGTKHHISYCRLYVHVGKYDEADRWRKIYDDSETVCVMDVQLDERDTCSTKDNHVTISCCDEERLEQAADLTDVIIEDDFVRFILEFAPPTTSFNVDYVKDVFWHKSGWNRDSAQAVSHPFYDFWMYCTTLDRGFDSSEYSDYEYLYQS